MTEYIYISDLGQAATDSFQRHPEYADAIKTSKIKCDGQKPCNRCVGKPNASCIYPDIYKDPVSERLDQLEEDQRHLRDTIDEIRRDATVASRPFIPSSEHRPETFPMDPGFSDPGSGSILDSQTQPFVPTDAGAWSSHGESHNPRGYELRLPNASHFVTRGIVTEQQGRQWFNSFFSGSHVFVPLFSVSHDTYDSISARSAFLLDAIISIGCRAEEGPRSTNYQRLQQILRERIASLIMDVNFDSTSTLETVQALIVLASYSENGWLVTSLALRIAIRLGLPERVDDLLLRISSRRRQGDGALVHEQDEAQLVQATRVWFGAFNLEHIFSLDGEKPPSITFTHTMSRVRAIVYHPFTTATDLRLLSQEELNITRSRAHTAVVNHWSMLQPSSDEELGRIIRDACLDLDLWLDEWSQIIHVNQQKYNTRRDYSSALLNLTIQHKWALITLHLKAVSNTGIENIAAMTAFQQSIVAVAKDSAVQHLRLLLKAPSRPSTPNGSADQDAAHHEEVRSTYLGSFRWAMDFVWAKCAFSILLVFRLSMILGDPPDSLIQLVRDAHIVLDELKRISTGHTAYFHILQVSIDKYEKALRGWIAQQSSSTTEVSAGSEFEEYNPREFVFEWNFPGLNLKHVPLGWQDLFLDLDSAL